NATNNTAKDTNRPQNNNAQNNAQPARANDNAANNRDNNRAGANNNTGQRDTTTPKVVTKEQETKISAAIKTANVRPLTRVDFSVSVGSVVPAHVTLAPLPASVIAIVPQYRVYDFFVVQDEIIIVEPRTKK